MAKGKQYTAELGGEEIVCTFEKLCLEIATWAAHNGVENLDVSVTVPVYTRGDTYDWQAFTINKTKIEKFNLDRWHYKTNELLLNDLMATLRGKGPDVDVSTVID